MGLGNQNVLTHCRCRKMTYAMFAKAELDAMNVFEIKKYTMIYNLVRANY